MGVYPGAKWEPIGVTPGHGSNGKMHAYLGIVLHCNDAQSLDLYGFTKANKDSGGATCHFQVTKDGTVYQYIDTQFSSWCQTDGNDTYLSIESQGLAGEQATPQQVAAIGGILAWASQAHGIPLKLAEAPGELGFGWHGMGALHGANWGHSLCPGVRKDQRDDMLAAAHPPVVKPAGPPWSHPPVPVGPVGIASPAALEPGQALVSPSKHYVAIFQADGNFVVRNWVTGNADHNTGTVGKGATQFTVQDDGNLVIYKGATPLWSSGTHGRGPIYLQMQDDGNLVAISQASKKPVWSSGTGAIK